MTPISTPRGGTAVLLTLEDVRLQLAVSRRQVERYVADGKLRVVRLGYRSVRVRPADLEAFIRRAESKVRAA